MSKKFLKIALILAVLAALAGGTIAVAAAGSDNPAPATTRTTGDTPIPDSRQFNLQNFAARILQLQNRLRVEALITRAENAGLITEVQATRILNAWDGAHPDWQSPVIRLFNRLMELQDRNRVETLLTRAQNAGLITEAQAARILNAWDNAHLGWQPPVPAETV